MNTLKNKEWWDAAITRALKTYFQTLVATVGTASMIGDVNWVAVLSTSALAGILSLCTSLAGLPEVNDTEDEAKEDEDHEH